MEVRRLPIAHPGVACGAGAHPRMATVPAGTDAPDSTRGTPRPPAMAEPPRCAARGQHHWHHLARGAAGAAAARNAWGAHASVQSVAPRPCPVPDRSSHGTRQAAGDARSGTHCPLRVQLRVCIVCLSVCRTGTVASLPWLGRLRAGYAE